MKYVFFLFISFGCFSIGFADENYSSKTTHVSKLIETTQTLTKQQILYPIKLNNAKQRTTVVRTTIAPGGNTGWHIHKVPEVVYVNKGILTLKIVKSNRIHTYTFKPGNAIVQAINTIHQGQNLGSTPVELIAVFIGREDLANITSAELPKNIKQESSSAH